MDRLHAIIHGHVQGVYFRQTTQQTAQKLELTGWVRNNADGTVEIIAEGQRNHLEEFVHTLHQGPPSADVVSIDLNWQDATGEFRHFKIQHV